MVKILCFLKRKPGMSKAAFREYYENNHAPLVSRLLPFYEEYYRNFLSDTQDYETGHLENKIENDPGFDVVTELTFATRENYEKMIAALGDPEIGGIITRDEENLFDRSKMTIYLVDEFRTA
jgi:hypothetical protein